MWTLGTGRRHPPTPSRTSTSPSKSTRVVEPTGRARTRGYENPTTVVTQFVAGPFLVGKPPGYCSRWRVKPHCPFHTSSLRLVSVVLL